eukprot:jgi/Bigna1/72522/fgenesh1_pg.20_\
MMVPGVATLAADLPDICSYALALLAITASVSAQKEQSQLPRLQPCGTLTQSKLATARNRQLMLPVFLLLSESFHRKSTRERASAPISIIEFDNRPARCTSRPRSRVSPFAGNISPCTQYRSTYQLWPSYIKAGGGGGKATLERREFRKRKFIQMQKNLDQAKVRRRIDRKERRAKRRQMLKLKKQRSNDRLANTTRCENSSKITGPTTANGAASMLFPSHTNHLQSKPEVDAAGTVPTRIKSERGKNQRKALVDCELNEIADFISTCTPHQQGRWLVAKCARTMDRKENPAKRKAIEAKDDLLFDNVMFYNRRRLKQEPVSFLSPNTSATLSSGGCITNLPFLKRGRGSQRRSVSLAARLRLLLQPEVLNAKRRQQSTRHQRMRFRDLVRHNNGTDHSRSQDENNPGSFPLMILTSSVGRAAEICRDLRTELGGEKFIARLSAKSSKPAEQGLYVKNNPVIAGVGTPHRVQTLLDSKQISLRELSLVAIDLCRDSKKRNILDIPETASAFWNLFSSHIAERLLLETHVAESAGKEGNSSSDNSAWLGAKIVMLDDNCIGYDMKVINKPKLGNCNYLMLLFF